MDDVTAAKILIKSLDLTSLNEADSSDDIKALCAKATTPYGNTAAVCIHQKFIPLALQQLSDNIRIATVVNFPQGTPDLKKTEAEINRALKAGADEIDAVFPYRSFLAEDYPACQNYLKLVREKCGQDHPLKIILETGELQTTRNIKMASIMCIDNGADFLKTSTGKSKIHATPEAANAMLEVIKQSKRPVGFKASGGIRSMEEAKKYLVLASSIMGPDWIKPQNFRIGASSLLNDLLQTIKRGF